MEFKIAINFVLRLFENCDSCVALGTTLLFQETTMTTVSFLEMIDWYAIFESDSETPKAFFHLN